MVKYLGSTVEGAYPQTISPRRRRRGCRCGRTHPPGPPPPRWRWGRRRFLHRDGAPLHLEGSWCRVQGSGFRVWVGVWGSGFKV